MYKRDIKILQLSDQTVIYHKNVIVEKIYTRLIKRTKVWRKFIEFELILANIIGYKI